MLGTNIHLGAPFGSELSVVELVEFQDCAALAFQGQILAVWTLVASLPDSDLNLAVDFWVEFFSCCSPRKIQKSTAKNPPHNSFT